MSVVKVGARVPPSEALTSRFVSRQLPSIFSDSESMLVPLLEAYYSWMEAEGNAAFDIKHMLEYMDFRKAPEEFLNFFFEEYLPGFPIDVAVDKRLLLAHAKDFFLSKGSEQSFKFLFRVLFNEDVSIYYPKDDIFRTSDAKWIVREVIKVDAFDNQLPSMEGRKIYGVDSGTTAYVESVVIQYVGTQKIAYVVISSRYGEFSVDEAISTTTEDETLPTIYARILGTVVSATITSPGTGYTLGTSIPLVSSGDGSGIFAVIDAIDVDGGILKIKIVDGGVNYVSVPPVPNIGAMSGSGAQFSFNIGGNFKESGYFVDDSCFLSSSKKLQDGKLYQEFSYVLKSRVPISKFGELIKRLVHPAGMYMAAELISSDTSEESNSFVSIMFHLSQPDGINYRDPSTTYERRFIQDTIYLSSFPSYRTIEELDLIYPDGLPLSVSLERIFGPEYLTALVTVDESYVDIIVGVGDGYVDSGYHDSGYFE